MSALKIADGTSKWIVPSDESFELRKTGSTFIDELFESETVVDIDGNSHRLETYIPASQGDLLYSLIRHSKPKRTLEIGLANGVSALHIASALRDLGSGHHLAIDPFQQTDWGSVGLESLRRAGLDDFVSLDARRSHWALPDLDRTGARFQFAFVDGSHLMDYVMTDFMVIDRILDVGGLIAFDDSDWPAVNQVIRFAMSNRNYSIFNTGTVIEPGPGRPKWVTRHLRGIVRRVASLESVFRGEFVYPSAELNIDGRCVVLQKNEHDQRHALTGPLLPF